MTRTLAAGTALFVLIVGALTYVVMQIASIEPPRESVPVPAVSVPVATIEENPLVVAPSATVVEGESREDEVLVYDE